MDSRRIEHIFIIILLLLNLFLLCVVLTEWTEHRHSDAETVEMITTMLRENGITADRDAVQLRSAPPRCTLVRNSQLEQEKLRALIGAEAYEDLGGNILFYRGEGGQASLRGSGEMDVLFSEGAVTLWGSAEKTALRTLKDMGLEARLLPDAEAKPGSLALCCCWNDYPVYNAVLQFDFHDEELYMISGTRVFDSQTQTDSTSLLDSASVLLRFVELLKAEGRVCSRLDSLQPGYLMNVTASGESLLTPVWRVETDTGVLLINAETGKAETVSV